MDLSQNRQNIILGAGLTGLSTGIISDCMIFEENMWPGGICATYGIKPGRNKRIFPRKVMKNVFKYEIGGGHWLWGSNKRAISFLSNFSNFRRYKRKASVYLPKLDLFVPYPLQYNLWKLPQDLAKKIYEEIKKNSLSNQDITKITAENWLINSFGETLSKLFFLPFNNLYTAGLINEISPIDLYKNPIDIYRVKRGLKDYNKFEGYNSIFRYPIQTWGVLAWNMAKMARIKYNKCAVQIDLEKKIVYFSDNTQVKFKIAVSTLPLNLTLFLCGSEYAKNADPYVSVLVTNVSGVRGLKCPSEHWIYFPNSKNGFHRVGVYTNVNNIFLPSSSTAKNKVSFYVEKAYVGGTNPSYKKQMHESTRMAQELKDMEYLSEIEIIDPTWINVAYTYRRTNSSWKEKACSLLWKHKIIQVGRYATWGGYQSILESIANGLIIGTKIKNQKLE